MTKKGIHIVFLFLFCFQIYSQSKGDSLALNFNLKYNKLPFEVNKKYVSSKKDTLTVETFRCYISNIQIQYDDQSVITQKDSYHLIDSDIPDSFKFYLTKKNDKIISKVFFNIGIDSLTNTAGALAGDLDPTKGMYWAWQSGYINMKIEGKSSSCKSRKNEFQFHIGGYLSPYYAMRKVELTYEKKATQINIGIDLYNFFANLNLAKTNSVMIPGTLAMELADYSKSLFYIE
ncbi:MAG: MbnP family protein [Flavobacterium sp.]|uniref:MbnP family protein n=1 Tax=Flavobacterium sp. TaxID=239 RepID=UPI003BD4AA56